MKIHMWTIVFCWLLVCCSKTESPAPTPPEPPVSKDPPQYGVPFAAVPDARDAVIYQVNIRAFSEKANFKGVQERLDSIRALGVNVLYLMPVYPVGKLQSVNSPYCVQDFTKVNPEFGNLDELRSLVAAAHDRNMTVLFDWVANHSSWDNPWTSNKSWYQQDAAGNIISPPNTGWNDVAQLNYKNAEMRLAMISAMKYWVYTANIDGYRCDAADFIPADFWKQAIDSLRAINTHKLLLFAEGTRKDHFAAGFQLEYGMGFYYNMVNNIYQKKGPVLSIDSVNQVEYTNASSGSQVVRYTSNHDVNNADGTPLQLLDGEKGSLAAFVTASCMNAVPMIYNGQEVGCPVKLNYFNSSTTINWNLNADIKAKYKAVLAARNSSDAIRRGTLQSYSTRDVCAFTKIYQGKTVLVLVNLRNSTTSYEVPAIAERNWKDLLNSASLNLDATVTLEPYQYLLLGD